MTKPTQPKTEVIPVEDVVVPAQCRTPDPKKVAELARSIEADGQLQAIGVRADGARYTLVFGGHRLAAHKELRRATIEAKILDMDEEEAEAAMTAENAFRNPLSKVEYIAQLKRWQEIHAKKFPESSGTAARAAAGKKGASAKAARREAAEGEPAEAKIEARNRALLAPKPAPGPAAEAAGPAPEPEPEPAPPTRFADAAAEATGRHPGTIKREAFVARTLSQTDLDILKGQGATFADLERLAKVENPVFRQRAISLRAAGMDTLQAIAFVHAPENATIEDVTPEPSGIKPEAEMTDDEWIAHYCADMLGRIRYHDAFKRDAILWRNTHDALNELRKKTRKPLARSKGGKSGPFAYRLTFLLDLLHPNDWGKCGPCDGTGQHGNVSQCPSCNGNGYTVVAGRAKRA